MPISLSFEELDFAVPFPTFPRILASIDSAHQIFFLLPLQKEGNQFNKFKLPPICQSWGGPHKLLVLWEAVFSKNDALQTKKQKRTKLGSKVYLFTNLIIHKTHKNKFDIRVARLLTAQIWAWKQALVLQRINHIQYWLLNNLSMRANSWRSCKALPFSYPPKFDSIAEGQLPLACLNNRTAANDPSEGPACWKTLSSLGAGMNSICS
jgi:hypothetical protein